MTLTIMEAAQSGDLTRLGELDGETYERLDLVVARDADGSARLFCRLSDWERTPAGRIIQAQTIITVQQQTIEALAARADAGDAAHEALAALQPVAQSARAQLDQLAAALAAKEQIIRDLTQQLLIEADRARTPATPPPAVQRFVCDACEGRAFASARALTMHRQKAHGAAIGQPTKAAAQDHYHCSGCDQVLPIDDFYTAIRSGVRVRARSQCRACCTRSSKSRPLSAREPNELTCPECATAGQLPPRPLTNARDLGQHRRFAHGVHSPTASPGDPAPARSPIRLVDEPAYAPPFRCADCGSDAFAASLHEPGRCVRCVKRAQ